MNRSMCERGGSEVKGVPPDKLRWERDLWEGAAYGLAQQVTQTEDRQQLRTLRRLQLGEKLWAELAHHFTTFLSQTDIEQVYTYPRNSNFQVSCGSLQLRVVDECVRKWREGVMGESGRLEEVETAMSERVS